MKQRQLITAFLVSAALVSSTGCLSSESAEDPGLWGPSCRDSVECPEGTECVAGEEDPHEHACAEITVEPDCGILVCPAKPSSGISCTCLYILGQSHYHCTANGVTTCHGPC